MSHDHQRCESRSRLLQALDRMVESCNEDIKTENLRGNDATVGFLQGELKGLLAARTYAEADATRSESTETTNATPQGQPELPREWRDAAHDAPAAAASGLRSAEGTLSEERLAALVEEAYTAEAQGWDIKKGVEAVLRRELSALRSASAAPMAECPDCGKTFDPSWKAAEDEFFRNLTDRRSTNGA